MQKSKLELYTLSMFTKFVFYEISLSAKHKLQENETQSKTLACIY